MAEKSGKMDRKMTEFISEIKTVPYTQKQVYAVLSDLNNLEKLRNYIPEGKIHNLEFDSNYVGLSIAPVGKLRIAIVEREMPKTIKFATEQSPIAVDIWIQLLPDGDMQTKMKLTLRAELNLFLKPMLSKPLQEGINQIAEVLTIIPYSDLL